MSECRKQYGARRLVCVKPKGHWGKHSHIRSAKGIGIELRRKTKERGANSVGDAQ